MTCIYYKIQTHSVTQPAQEGTNRTLSSGELFFSGWLRVDQEGKGRIRNRSQIRTCSWGPALPPQSCLSGQRRTSCTFRGSLCGSCRSGQGEVSTAGEETGAIISTRTSTQSLCRLTARWPALAGFLLRVHYPHPSINYSVKLSLKLTAHGSRFSDGRENNKNCSENSFYFQLDFIFQSFLIACI